MNKNNEVLISCYFVRYRDPRVFAGSVQLGRRSLPQLLQSPPDRPDFHFESTGQSTGSPGNGPFFLLRRIICPVEGRPGGLPNRPAVHRHRIPNGSNILVLGRHPATRRHRKAHRLPEQVPRSAGRTAVLPGTG